MSRNGARFAVLKYPLAVNESFNRRDVEEDLKLNDDVLPWCTNPPDSSIYYNTTCYSPFIINPTTYRVCIMGCAVG